ncbi:calcium-binding protein [Rhizobium sp. LjRoot254]|uniref:calcium-binding protein n=1 Tax=Rhizobium sp. LjRoot254 TaxID=3342297 RepID=UPI003ECE6008
MAKTTTIRKILTEEVFIEDNNNIINITRTGKVITDTPDMGDPSSTVGDSGLAKNNIFNIDGSVIGMEFAASIEGEGSEIHVGKTGFLQGGWGAGMFGQEQVLVNNGLIVGGGPDGDGVFVYVVADGKIVNNGTILGAQYAIEVAQADGLSITNGRNGLISGNNIGIAIDSQAGDANRMVNLGLINVTGSYTRSIVDGDGSINIRNKGILSGGVELGGGDDVFNGLGGTMVRGFVIGGLGNDTMFIDSADLGLSEEIGEGTDTIKSAISYTLDLNVENLTLLGKKNVDGTGNGENNILHGNAGDNTLNGDMGDDSIYGHRGDDELTGSSGSDTFFFGTKDGHDTITDFVSGAVDLINLSAWKAFDDFADVLASAKDKGTDVVITLGEDSLTIEDYHKADLLDIFFSFV